MNIQTVSPDKIQSENATILDVRTEMECAEKRLCCDHVHVPLDILDAEKFISQHNLKADSFLYILCRSGQRAARAAEKFIEKGMTNVFVIKGGIVSCEECGEKLQGHLVKDATPTDKRHPIALERQVRIVAGLLVLAGSLLGFYYDRDFIFLPAFVGAGLIFAGVTDRCGMALLLTKMPWNKI